MTGGVPCLFLAYARCANCVHVLVGAYLQQMNTTVTADNHEECALEIIQKKCKLAGGADYDTGSNAKGYKSKGGSIRAASLKAYQGKVRHGAV